MSRLRKLVMPSVLVGLLSCCVLANADSPAPPKGAATATVSQSAAPLTDETLPQMLRGLGYEPEIVNSLDDGRKVYRIRMNYDGWTFTFDVLLSPDRTVLWIESYLGNIPAGDKIQSEALLTLLKLNASATGKAKFIITQNGAVWLWMPQDNVGITPSLLRERLESTARIVKSTAASWKTGRWTAQGKEAMAFQEKVTALYARVAEAAQEFSREINPVHEGRPVNRERLKQAHAKLLRTIREVRAELNGLKAPDSAAAREYLDCWQQLLEADESFFANEMVEVLRILEDDTISPADRVAKIQPILKELNKKEEAALKALKVAREKFNKHYGDI